MEEREDPPGCPRGGNSSARIININRATVHTHNSVVYTEIRKVDAKGAVGINRLVFLRYWNIYIHTHNKVPTKTN